MYKCGNCDTTKYGYSDGTRVIFICFRCGSFDGLIKGDEKFIEKITRDPDILLQMIKDHTFKAI